MLQACRDGFWESQWSEDTVSVRQMEKSLPYLPSPFLIRTHLKVIQTARVIASFEIPIAGLAALG